MGRSIRRCLQLLDEQFVAPSPVAEGRAFSPGANPDARHLRALRGAPTPAPRSRPAARRPNCSPRAALAARAGALRRRSPAPRSRRCRNRCASGGPSSPRVSTSCSPPTPRRSQPRPRAPRRRPRPGGPSPAPTVESPSAAPRPPRASTGCSPGSRPRSRRARSTAADLHHEGSVTAAGGRGPPARPSISPSASPSELLGGAPPPISSSSPFPEVKVRCFRPRLGPSVSTSCSQRIAPRAARAR
jgi:hypothetical protein